jgi:hypothetical protein
MDDVLRRWGGIIGLVLLTLTHLWENNIGLSRLRDIRIGKEYYLLFVLRDVPRRCVHLLGIVIKVDMLFSGCIGGMLVFWVFKRW